MLISALCKYHDTLAANKALVEDGYSFVNVSYRIMLSENGDIASIERCTKTETTVDKNGKEKKREVPMECVMPKRSEKPGIDFNVAEHRPLYIFGIAIEEDKGNKIKYFSETSKAQKSHALFKEKSLEYTEGMDSPLVRAFRAFVEKWEPAEHINDPMLLDIMKDYDKCGYCLALYGHPEELLNNDTELLEKYNKSLTKTEDDDLETGVCSITGKQGVKIGRIHGKIKGIRGGQPSGTSLACFNNPSDESYGKKQSVNSSISTDAAKKYVEALNWLLREENHHKYIDDMTLVYWADTRDKETDDAVCDFFDMFINDQAPEAQKERTDSRLSAFMAKAGTGELFSENIFGDESASLDFYVACFTPNASRICLKFMYKNSVGKFADNITLHQKDLYHSGLKDNRQLPLGTLIKELYSPKSNNRSPSYPLYASILNSILNGTVYPESLLGTIIQRCRTDDGKFAVNDVRISLIKACLNRKARLTNKQEVIPMALDTENTSQAYLCGRLFALLEKAQNAALGKLDKTIKDSYFASACTKPSSVFPRLMMLAQHHLEKAEYGRYYDKLITEAASKLDGKFPSTLTLDEQGEFIVGYYQQKQALSSSNKEQ